MVSFVVRSRGWIYACNRLCGPSFPVVRTPLAGEHWSRHVQNAPTPGTFVRVHQTLIGHDQKLTTRGKTALQALFGRRVFAEPHSNSVKYGLNQRSSWLVVSSLGAKHRF